AGELVPDATSRAIFLDHEGALVPEQFESPQASKLANARLLNEREPLVEHAYRRGAVARLTPDLAAGTRLFDRETRAVALPLPRIGVLYIGKENGSDFSPEQVHVLTMLAGQGAPALAFARTYERLETDVRDTQVAQRGLQEWAEGLNRLLEASSAMVSSLEAGQERLLSHLDETLGSLFPNAWHAVVLGPSVRCAAEYDALSLERVGQAILTARRPLLLEDRDARFPRIWPAQRSLVGVPVRADEEPIGVLLVGAPAASSFSRVQQDLLSVLAYQLAIALRNAALHAEVVEAYRRLQESRVQLIQSSKMAAVGELAAGVAHELNTPLGTILLAIEAAQMNVGERPEIAAKKLKRAYDELLRAREIVSKLLYYSRDAASAGKREVDPERLLRDTLDLIGHQLEEDGAAVTVEVSPVQPVTANANEIQQVLINLLLNARDAVAQRPEPRIQARVSQEGSRIRFEVEDNGSGIPQDIQEKIFDPFFTTKPVGKGTGLGLSVSRQIVSAHQGALSVRSSPGQGSTFTLELPIGAR
ncbi:MAG: HAMP domain-containing sensor histidine kinase, partial [Candidatus Eremiobacterota bacterium]